MARGQASRSLSETDGLLLRNRFKNGPFQALASRDIRIRRHDEEVPPPLELVPRRLRDRREREACPWGMIDKFEEAFGKGTLNLLPDHPRFVFCGTEMAVGATRGPKDRCGGRGREAGLSSNFVFERDRVGSYLAGYAPPDGFTLAQAVAPSACFPPLVGPLRIDRAAERFKGGRTPGVNADTRRQILEDL